MRNVRPLQQKIVVRRDEPQTTTPSGLLLPETSQEPCDQGRVIAVGKGPPIEGGAYAMIALSPGDRVLFQKKVGYELEPFDPDLKDHVILHEDNILGVIS